MFLIISKPFAGLTHFSTFCFAVVVAEDCEGRSKALHTPFTRKCCNNDTKLYF